MILGETLFYNISMSFLSKRTLLLLVLIAAAGMAVYSNAFQVPFIFDDGTYIVDNPIIRSFRNFVFPSEIKDLHRGAYFLPGAKQAFKTRPLAFLTFALNYRLNGLDVWGYHLVNLLIHIVNSILVFGFVMITFKTLSLRGKGGLERPVATLTYPQAIAFFTALFFAVHPVQTQAVTYITQRFASLAALFFLASLASYAAFRLSEGKKTKVLLYAASLSGAILAMLTKEMSFTLPIVMAVYEFIFLKGNSRKRAVLLAPFFLAMLIIPLNLSRGGLHASMTVLGDSQGMSRWGYLFTELRVLVTYIRLLFFPVNQNLDYDYPAYGSIFEPPVFLSFLFLSGLFLLAVFLLYRAGRRGEERIELRLISFGIFWFFITISVESGLVPLRDFIYEHRLYLPSVGFLLAFTAFLLSQIGRLKRFRLPALVAPLVLALALGGAAYARNNVWGSKISLWEDAVRKSPNKFRPHYTLAFSYYEAGLYMLAVREGRISVALEPNDPLNRFNLALFYEKTGMLDEAVNEFRAAIELNPWDSIAHYNLGRVYRRLGRSDEARREFEESIALSRHSQGY